MGKNSKKGQGKAAAPKTAGQKKNQPQVKKTQAKSAPPKGQASKKQADRKSLNMSLIIGAAFGGAFVGLGLYGAIGQGNAGGYYIAALGLLVFGGIGWSYWR